MTNYLTRIGFCIALAAFAVPTIAFADEASATKEGKGKAKAGPKSLEEQMIGYWAPDVEQMLKLFTDKVGGDANAEAMMPMIKGMLATMVFDVQKGKVMVHAMGQPQSSTYKITKTDEATKTLTMTVTDQAGAGEGTAVIKGNKLVLSKDKEDIHLNRIDKAEFEKRKAAGAENLPFPK